MIIAKDLVVTIDYEVKNEEGIVIDSSQTSGSLPYLHGYQNIIPGLENALDGHKEGDEIAVTVVATDAYGEYNEQLVQTVGKETFEDPADIEEGMQFQADTPEGAVLFTVIKVEGNSVTVDGNHPLAGMTLSFTAQVKEVRVATEEELGHGHVHHHNHSDDGHCC